MIEIEKPKIECVEDPANGTYGKFTVEPLERGYGITLGNALRRIMLSSLPGTAATSIKIAGVQHEFSTIPGVKEDVTEIVLNVKSLITRLHNTDGIKTVYIEAVGPCEVKAGDIKGKVKRGGFQDGWVETMEEHGVPEWYITSLSKIAYLFPKAHAVAYVMMAFRIAWFKVHEPLAFYSAYFYRRSQKDSFDADMMTRGLDYTRRKINELRNKPTLTAKEEDLLVTLEAVYEFNLRGFEFAPMSLYESDATKFLIRDGKLLPPFVAISGLGESAAWNLVACRADGREFVSVEELSAACPKVSQTHLEQLRAMGALGEMPDSSQMSLF